MGGSQQGVSVTHVDLEKSLYPISRHKSPLGNSILMMHVDDV